VGDEKCVNDALLCEVEETSEASTPHVQPRTDIGEDQRTGLEVSSAMSGESLELSVKVTIGLLAMSRNPSVDSTSFLVGMIKNLSLKQTKQSVYFC